MYVCLYVCVYACMRAHTHPHTPTHPHTHLLPRGDTRLLAHQAPICVRKLLPLRRRAARAARAGDELLVQEVVLGLLELDLREGA